MLDGTQESITTQARAASICRTFAKKSDKWKGAQRATTEGIGSPEALQKERRGSEYNRYNIISKLSRDTLVICKYLNEVNGMKGEDW